MKNFTPNINPINAVTIEKINAGTYILADGMMHHLNPSITPTNGLMEYINLRLVGITELVYATGDKYIPNCNITGIIYFISLYFTLSVEKNKPNPKAIMKAKIIKHGNNNIFIGGKYPVKIIIINKTSNEITKSIKAVTTEAIGKVSLGKYIFFIIWPLLTRLLDTPLNAAEKKFHGKSAEYTIIA